MKDRIRTKRTVFIFISFSWTMQGRQTKHSQKRCWAIFLTLLSNNALQCHSFAWFHLKQQKGTLSDSSLSSLPHEWIVPQGVAFGSLDKLQFLPMPEGPESGHRSTCLCTVSTRAIGLNFADIFCVLGLYAAANEIRNGTAFCPGLEFAGVIVDDPTNTYQPGQRVFGFTRFGAYADIVRVPPDYLWPLPSSWTFTDGASFLVQALTAWHGLVEIARMPTIKASNTTYVVMVHSAAGGVGLWASEIAARRGAVVIGVVGSNVKEQVFRQRIIPLSPRSRTLIRGEERSFAKRLAALLYEIHNGSTRGNREDLTSLRKQGHGVDIIMESLGGQYFSDSFESLNSGGALVTFGSTSYVNPGMGINTLRLVWRYLNRPKIDPGALTARNIRLAGFNLIYLTDQVATLRQELEDCMGTLNCNSHNSAGFKPSWLGMNPLENVTKPVIGKVFDFRTETVLAMEVLKSGKTTGKIVLENGNNSIGLQR